MCSIFRKLDVKKRWAIVKAEKTGKLNCARYLYFIRTSFFAHWPQIRFLTPEQKCLSSCRFQLPEDWSCCGGPQMPLLCQGPHLRHCHFKWRALPSLSPPPSAHGGESANLYQKSGRVDPAWKGGGTRKECHGWGLKLRFGETLFSRKSLEFKVFEFFKNST